MHAKKTDNFCKWASPIMLTKKEISTMSEYSLQQIVSFNDMYEIKCDGD